MTTFIILILPVHGHGRAVCLSVFFTIFLCCFKFYILECPPPPWLGIFQGIYLLEVIVKGVDFLISFSVLLSLAYRKATKPKHLYSFTFNCMSVLPAWDWSYGELLATMCVQETKPWSIGRGVSTLNHWAIFPYIAQIFLNTPLCIQTPF